MAMIDTSRTAPFGAETALRLVTLAERALNALDAAAAGLRARIVAERTHTALSKLSPHQLQDIGLSEGSLRDFSEAVARRHTRR